MYFYIYFSQVIHGMAIVFQILKGEADWLTQAGFSKVNGAIEEGMLEYVVSGVWYSSHRLHAG